MHSRLKNALVGATALLLIGASTARAQVGLTSNVATVALTATKSGHAVGDAGCVGCHPGEHHRWLERQRLHPGEPNDRWNLTAGSSVRLIGWFGTPAQALANGTDFIPSSKVEGRVGVTAYAPFTGAPVGAVGVAGGTLQLFSQAVAAGSCFGIPHRSAGPPVWT